MYCLLKMTGPTECSKSVYDLSLSLLSYFIVLSICLLILALIICSIINCYYKHRKCVDCSHKHYAYNEICGHIMQDSSDNPIYRNLRKYLVRNHCECNHYCHKNNACKDSKQTLIGFKNEPHEYTEKIQVGTNKVQDGEEKEKYLVRMYENTKDVTVATDEIDHYDTRVVKKKIHKEWKNVESQSSVATDAI